MKTIEDYNTLVKTYIDTKDSAKAPTDHSSTATTYGVGSTTKYGHVKVDDALSSTSTNPVQNKKVYELKQALSNEVETRATLGVHQFLDYDLAKLKALNIAGTWNNNKYTLNGVEITVNDDNSLTISTDANGATGVVDFIINNKIYLEDDTYTLDVDVTTFDSYTYTRVMGWNGSSWVELANRPRNFTASGTYQYYQLVIRLLAGATFNPSKTYKPLIKLASDSSTKFTPYAKTNRELTDNVKVLASNFKNLGEIEASQIDNIPSLFFPELSSAGARCYYSFGYTISGIGAARVDGYEYYGGTYGCQIRMLFNGSIMKRYKNGSSTWSAWENV